MSNSPQGEVSANFGCYALLIVIVIAYVILRLNGIQP